MSRNHVHAARHAQQLAITVIIAATVSPMLRAESAPALSNHRWHEIAHGLSLRPPAGATKVEQTTDNALVKFLMGKHLVISVHIRQSNEPLSMKTWKKKALQQIAFLYPSVVDIKDHEPEIRLAGRPSTKLYLLVPDQERGNWIFGQALVKIDLLTMAVISMEGDAATFEHDQMVFEAVLDSLDLMNPKQLDRIRADQIKAGTAWRSTISREQLKQVMVDEQWFQIVEQDRDVGWMRVRHREDGDPTSPGIQVHVQSRVLIAEDQFDTESRFIESDDGTMEYWDIITTQRAGDRTSILPGSGAQAMVKTWRQHAVRSHRAIEINRDAPATMVVGATGSEQPKILGLQDRLKADSSAHVRGPRPLKLKYLKPEKGYLSQVEVHLLPSLFPRQTEHQMAFYAYFPNAEKISLRSFRIVPLNNRGYQVHMRPTSDRGEQVSTYDRRGKLLRRQMPDGRAFVATTPDKLRTIWKIP